MKQRSIYLDAIKGLAIVLVVLGHSVQFGSGMEFYSLGLFFSDSLFKFIYGFHMPLFMVVSGYLFWGTVNRYHPWSVFVSRVRALALPILVWQTSFLCCLLLAGSVSLSVWLLSTYPGSLWFLTSVLFCSIMVLAGHVAFRDSPLFHAVVTLGLLFVPNSWLDGLHVFMYPYFTIGFLWNKYGCKDYYGQVARKWKWLVLVAAACMYAVLFEFYDKPEHSVYLNGTSLYGRESIVSQAIVDVLRYAYGWMGVVMTMVGVDLWFTSRCRPSKRIQCVLRQLGQSTMGIYILNHYMLQFMLELPVNSNCYYLLTLIETVVLLIVYFWTVWLIRRNRFTRLFLLGER